MQSQTISALALPAVSALIAFLSYSSQYLFYRIDPAPLDRRQALIFNGLVAAIWISYLRACWTDPGRVPAGWDKEAANGAEGEEGPKPKPRWCRKCEAVKPPRAHHCKQCKRCVPKMDHHCPWTVNCVSHTTLPHFMRFVFYAVAAMAYLEVLLWQRCVVIYRNRELPSYLGPSPPLLLHLFTLLLTNTLTLFALAILLLRATYALATNTTTIEGWEIERHHALVRRARALGGYAYGPDGIKVKVTRQEFPYDVGVWRNLKQGMGGSGNILSWLNPLSPTPPLTTGLAFETNGFESPALAWPPLDPERIPKTTRFLHPDAGFVHRASGPSLGSSSGVEGEASGAEPNPTNPTNPSSAEIQAFRLRQRRDMLRWTKPAAKTQQQHKQGRGEGEEYASSDDGDGAAAATGEEEAEEEEGEEEGEYIAEGEWTNAEGDRLRDFGVDEETEVLDEEEVPLGELLRRRRRREEGGGRQKGELNMGGKKRL